MKASYMMLKPLELYYFITLWFFIIDGIFALICVLKLKQISSSTKPFYNGFSYTYLSLMTQTHSSHWW